MELGELEEHSLSKTPVVVNTLGKWQIHWDVVKDVFAVGLREHGAIHGIRCTCAEQNVLQNKTVVASLSPEGTQVTNGSFKIALSPSQSCLVQMTSLLFPPASGQHTFWVTPSLSRSKCSLCDQLCRLGFCFWLPCHSYFFRGENLNFPNAQPLCSNKHLETQVFHKITQ